MSPASTVCSSSTVPPLVNNDDAASGFDFERFCRGCRILRLFVPSSQRWDGAHGGGVEGAVLDAEVDGGLVDTGVAAVGDDGLGVVLFAVWAPHLAGAADGAGMEASMMMSLGTCRLVMPLSLSTMAMA